VSLRRIVLCADDYALSPGVSRSIRELIGMGRLNATSVMTVFSGLKEEAAKLAETKSPIQFQTGLHVTLTGGFKPLVALPLKTKDGNFPPVKAYLNPLNTPKISRAGVTEEIEAQFRAFRDAFGRLPDFVDGHQHVQLMPSLRSAFLDTVAKLAPRAWVRQCGPASALQAAGGSKTRFLALLNSGFRSQARARGLAFNPAFAGAYDFADSREYAVLFGHFLKGLPSGGLIMCHPGFVDAELKSRDPLLDQREAEHKFFASDNLPTLLTKAGATLG
jgi:chitin disaccharide deacetylase